MRTKFSCRVGIDVRMAGFSGIGRYIRGMVSALADEHPDGNYGLIGKEEACGSFPAKFQFLGLRTPVYSLREQWDWFGLGRNIECLHIPHYNAPLFWNRKLIVTIHDLIHLHFPNHLPSQSARSYARIMIPWVIEKADAIIAVSEYTKQDILETFSVRPEKITVIHHGVDLQFMNVSRPKEQETKMQDRYFLYVGLIKEHKNLGVLLDAFDRLKEKNNDPRLKLYLVGRADIKQGIVRRWLARLTNRPDIVLMSSISDEQLRALYQNAIALVFPSFYEGFGFPLLEAMTAETPVIAAPLTSVPEVLGRSAALYFDPKSSTELEGCLLRMLTESSLRVQLVTEAKKRLPLFNWRIAAQKTRKVYETVIGSN